MVTSHEVPFHPCTVWENFPSSGFVALEDSNMHSFKDFMAVSLNKSYTKCEYGMSPCQSLSLSIGAGNGLLPDGTKPLPQPMWLYIHYSEVIMSTMASQITGVSIVYSTVCSGADQRKYQSSASEAFVRGIHRWPVNSLHKGLLTKSGRGEGVIWILSGGTAASL